jgi:hypothetical protein
MLAVQNPGVVRLRVKSFNVVELPVYACFSWDVSSEILRLVHKAGRSVSAEEVGEGETVADEGYAFRCEGQGIAGIAIVA